MKPTIPQVHLVVCLDPRIAPGPVLQALDAIRSNFWQQEVVCLCDKSWHPFLGNEATVLSLDKESIYSDMQGADISAALDALLLQLDDFEIKEVTIVGELKWGRWLQSYFETRNVEKYTEIPIKEPKLSLQVINAIFQNLEIEPMSLAVKKVEPKSVFVDPYEKGVISKRFLNMIQGARLSSIPNWLKIITDADDISTLTSLGLKNLLVERSEAEVHLSVDPILCFDDNSVYAQTSRSYKVAVFSEFADKSLFFGGDLHVQATNEIDLVELANVINYWRADRLQELSFQWLNMGLDIHVVEHAQQLLVRRNLMGYSTDLENCHHILELYNQRHGTFKARELRHILQDIRRANQNNSYSLSFSLKFLILIVERMILSLKSRERLFQRLGSDHHRILVAETIFEKIYDQSHSIDSTKCLQKFIFFLDFLVRVDTENDQFALSGNHKESA